MKVSSIPINGKSISGFCKTEDEVHIVLKRDVGSSCRTTIKLLCSLTGFILLSLLFECLVIRFCVYCVKSILIFYCL